MTRVARIGLWTVVAIVGVLVVLYASMPKFDERRIHSDRAIMLSDMTSLRTFEEQFFTDSGYYTANLLDRFHPSSGIGLPHLVVRDSTWSATLRWSQVPGVECGVAVGMPNPIHVTGDGEVWCTKIPYR